MPEVLQKTGYILLVEEDTRTIRTACEILNRHGYSVEVIGNSTEALAKAQENRPSLVIAGDPTPGIAGAEFVALVRQSPAFSKLPIILLRTQQYRGDEGRTYGNPLLEGVILLKPFNPQELLSYVRRILA